MTWGFWPMSEDQLLKRATVLMDTGDPLNWDIARRDYLSKLQTKYPDGKSAPLVREYVDKIDMHDAEEKPGIQNQFWKANRRQRGSGCTLRAAG